MRKAQRWRYYCDHCKKTGGSSFHMIRHERGCTANPNRICGVCEKGGMSPAPLTKLIEFLQASAKRRAVHDEFTECTIDGAGLDELRKLADGCPVCMFAALRQGGIYVEGNHFDLKTELSKAWNEINAAGDRHNYDY